MDAKDVKVTYQMAKPEDYGEIIDLANFVFSYASPVPHEFKTLIPKAYGPDRTMWPEHFLARENGRIRGMVEYLHCPLTCACWTRRSRSRASSARSACVSAVARHGPYEKVPWPCPPSMRAEHRRTTSTCWAASARGTNTTATSRPRYRIPSTLPAPTAATRCPQSIPAA